MHWYCYQPIHSSVCSRGVRVKFCIYVLGRRRLSFGFVRLSLDETLKLEAIFVEKVERGLVRRPQSSSPSPLSPFLAYVVTITSLHPSNHRSSFIAITTPKPPPCLHPTAVHLIPQKIHVQTVIFHSVNGYEQQYHQPSGT